MALKESYVCLCNDMKIQSYEYTMKQLQLKDTLIGEYVYCKYKWQT